LDRMDDLRIVFGGLLIFAIVMTVAGVIDNYYERTTSTEHLEEKLEHERQLREQTEDVNKQLLEHIENMQEQIDDLQEFKDEFNYLREDVEYVIWSNSVNYTEDDIELVADWIFEYSIQNRIDPLWVARVVAQESNFRWRLVNPSSGAIGGMQIMPNTARHIASMKGMDWWHKSDREIVELLQDPETNIKFGTYYMSWCLEQADGNHRIASAMYNAGIGNVQRWQAQGIDVSNPEEIPYEETANYVSNVS